MFPSGATRIRRGRLLSFDSTDWTAIVQLDGSLGAVTMPVGEWVIADTMVDDGTVAVLLFDDNNPNDGVIVGPYGSAGALNTPREKLTAARTYYVGYDIGTVTMTIASPCVVSKTAHGLQANDPIVFRTTGALPTGITAGTVYYVISAGLTANAFEFSTTVGGSAVNTSGSQSGTHSLHTGNDSNDGLTTGRAGAWLTIQNAINVTAALDMSIYDVTIQLAAGLYSTSAGDTCKQCIGAGKVIILGDETTPGNVVVTTTGANPTTFTSDGISTLYSIRGIKFTSTGSGTAFALIAAHNSFMQFQNIELGSGLGQQLRCSDGGSLQATGNYTISGGGVAHLIGVRGSIRVQGFTVTLTGTPAFTTAFISLSTESVAILSGNTFSGSATGKHYSVADNSVLYTVAAGGVSGWTEADLPGDTLGTCSNGGRYNNFKTAYRVATQFDKANTTLADITGLTATMLLAGRTYRFKAILYTTSNVASGVKAAIAGTATATAIIYEAMVYQTGVLVAPGTSRATALATTVANVTAVTVATIIIEGSVTVNAAGTLTVQFADNAGTNTSSVLVGSILQVEDVTP